MSSESRSLSFFNCLLIYFFSYEFFLICKRFRTNCFTIFHSLFVVQITEDLDKIPTAGALPRAKDAKQPEAQAATTGEDIDADLQARLDNLRQKWMNELAIMYTRNIQNQFNNPFKLIHLALF